jgi:hypothetical protein
MSEQGRGLMPAAMAARLGDRATGIPPVSEGKIYIREEYNR